MARGMVVGEAIQSQAQSRAFDANWDAMEHKPSPERGRFVWDETLQKLVRPSERQESRAADAPILSGRFYENTCATDGEDIGSRRKHREYMRRHGVTTADDYRQSWKQAEQRREAVKQGQVQSKSRREALERKFYQLQKP